MLRVDNGDDEEESLKNTISDIHHGCGIKEKCVWMANNNKLFSVNLFYKLIMQEEEVREVNETTMEALSVLWETKVPSKIKIFSWRMLLDKLPSRKQLIRRNTIPDTVENLCSLCSSSEESITRLLFNCQISVWIWKQVL